VSCSRLEEGGGDPGGGPYSTRSSVSGPSPEFGCCWFELIFVAPAGGSYMGGRAALGSYTGGGTACMS